MKLLRKKIQQARPIQLHRSGLALAASRPAAGCRCQFIRPDAREEEGQQGSKRGHPRWRMAPLGDSKVSRWTAYFFLPLAAGLAAAAALRLSSMAACAAARRATGTRYGEQLT